MTPSLLPEKFLEVLESLLRHNSFHSSQVAPLVAVFVPPQIDRLAATLRVDQKVFLDCVEECHLGLRLHDSPFGAASDDPLVNWPVGPIEIDANGASLVFEVRLVDSLNADRNAVPVLDR